MRDHGCTSLKYGAKIYPEDIAGMVGLPHVGDIYYVDPTNGSDTANNGKSQNNAFKTLTTAYAATTDNHHDVIVIVPGGVGTGTGTVETAAITWSKNLTHLVGNCPGNFAGRARVTTSTASLTPFITISGSGCIFTNIQFSMGTATGLYLVKVTGSRNEFNNVHFAGPASATALDTAASAACWLYQASENTFNNCIFGVDTVLATAASAVLEMSGDGTSGCARNTFNNCRFVRWADAAAALWVKIDGNNDIDRFVDFNGCFFTNFTGGGGTAMTVGMDLGAAPGGFIVLRGGTVSVGATDWADTFDYLKVEPVYASNTTGLLTTAT